MATKNPTPEVGDHWQRVEDGRTFLVEKLTAHYASGIWLEEERVVVSDEDDSKKKIRIEECAGGVLTRSLASADRFRHVRRSR
jgi:hypothetical protein